MSEINPNPTPNTSPNEGPRNIPMSLEKFYPRELINQAWALTNGNKLTINVLIAGTFVSIYVLTYILFSIFSIGPTSEPTFFRAVIAAIPSIVSAPFSSAVLMAGIFIARGDTSEVNFSLFKKYLPQFGTLALVALLYNVLVTLGMLLLILPGIFLSVTLIFAYPLVLDKKLQPIEALLLSLRETSSNFLQVFLAFVTCAVINCLGVLALGVGLIWTLPLTTIVFGLLYEKIFINGK